MEDKTKMEQWTLELREHSPEEISKKLWDQYKIRVQVDWIKKTLDRFPEKDSQG